MPPRNKGLARLSAYRRAEEHLQQRTVHGGIVTLLGCAVALILFVCEAHRCLSYRLVQKMKVDTRRDEMLHIRFNISFPALPCNALVLDTGDSSGQYRSEYGLSFARNGEVHKWRLDASGRRLDRAEYHPPRAGGGNTAFPLNFDIGHDTMEAMRKAMVAHEGCLVYGWIAAQRVAGNLHLSVRPEAMFMSMNENEIIAALMSRQLQLRLQRAESLPLLNASHAIHTLRFGEGAFPGQVFPLEGAARTDRLATGIDKYFIKVVPTTYFPGGWRRPLETQQYSVTEYYTRVDPKTDNKLPGLFFIYDTSPIAMDVTRTREGWLHFLVRFAAVVGGAFALTGAWCAQAGEERRGLGLGEK